MEATRKKWYTLYTRMKHMCRNLTVHGPRFLARRDIAFIYKCIYFIIYVQVWIIAVATIVKYYSTYQENTIRFTTRTDYLHWNTTFPSITICEIAATEDNYFAAKNKNKNMQLLSAFIREMTFYHGLCHTCSTFSDHQLLNLTDLKNVMTTYRTECKDYLIRCEWNSKPINCCIAFKPITTEYGTCLTVNNIQNQGSYFLHITGEQQYTLGTLTVILSKNSEAFLHSPEDIPFWNMEYDRRLVVADRAEATMVFSITEVVNEPEISLTPPEERQCRFPDELPSNFYAFKKYSYSACIIQCRILVQLELCNCTHHISPVIYNDTYCNIEGLQCLTKNYGTLKKLKIPGVNDTGLNCDCLPSCIESDYNIVAKKSSATKYSQSGGVIHFKLSNRPYKRVTRQMARTTLDLVVAMGNCFGLCFGGSLLSIAEIIYYVCLRQW